MGEQLNGTSWAQWEAPELLDVLIERAPDLLDVLEDIFDAIDEEYMWEY